MAGFAITGYLGATSLSAAPRKGQDIRRISYYDLVPSEDNFYSMDEIAALKASRWKCWKRQLNLSVKRR